MGLLLGYSILNLPTMIISCYGSMKNKFLDRRAQRSNDPSACKMATNLAISHSRKAVATNTVVMDTNCCKTDKEWP